MEELPFNLPLLQKIWKEVEANDDARLRENKVEVDRKYAIVVKNPLSTSARLAFSSDGLLDEPSPKEIMIFILEVVDFILGVSCFYEQLQTYQPLTEQDKELGKSLKALLQQADDNLLALKKWNLAILAAEGPNSFGNYTATNPKAAV